MTLADQTRTKTAYNLQWNRFRILRPDEDRATFANRTGLTAADLAGKVVLDGGCGMGRYLRIASEMAPAVLVGIDLSGAVRGGQRADGRATGNRHRPGRLAAPTVSRRQLRPRLLDRRDRSYARSPGGLSPSRRTSQAWRDVLPSGSIAASVQPWSGS